jgi:hypothetical protein
VGKVWWMVQGWVPSCSMYLKMLKQLVWLVSCLYVSLRQRPFCLCWCHHAVTLDILIIFGLGQRISSEVLSNFSAGRDVMLHTTEINQTVGIWRVCMARMWGSVGKRGETGNLSWRIAILWKRSNLNEKRRSRIMQRDTCGQVILEPHASARDVCILAPWSGGAAEPKFLTYRHEENLKELFREIGFVTVAHMRRCIQFNHTQVLYSR